jgi:hypothetical protein
MNPVLLSNNVDSFYYPCLPQMSPFVRRIKRELLPKAQSKPPAHRIVEMGLG